MGGLIIKKIGYVDPNLPMDEWIEASRKLPTGVYDETGKKLLFKSDDASEAIQWAIDYHYKIQLGPAFLLLPLKLIKKGKKHGEKVEGCGGGKSLKRSWSAEEIEKALKAEEKRKHKKGKSLGEMFGEEKTST